MSPQINPHSSNSRIPSAVIATLFGRFASAYQPAAHLSVVNRRVDAIGCGAQVELGSIDVPWLRPPTREFVDLGYDFENQAGMLSRFRFTICSSGNGPL